MSATKQTFTPAPELKEHTEVYDVKEWMNEVTPAIHDHLKAHLFKFEQVSNSNTRMFYKEWSTDDVWLPSQGLGILEGAHQSGALPIKGCPGLVQPTIPNEDLKKLSTTISKVAGYLEKSGAKVWWETWLRKAEEICSQSQSIQPTEGILTLNYNISEIPWTVYKPNRKLYGG